MAWVVLVERNLKEAQVANLRQQRAKRIEFSEIHYAGVGSFIVLEQKPEGLKYE